MLGRCQTSDPQMADCIFCAIVRGKALATFLHQDDLVVAFMDIGRCSVGISWWCPGDTPS